MINKRTPKSDAKNTENIYIIQYEYDRLTCVLLCMSSYKIEEVEVVVVGQTFRSISSQAGQQL